MTLAEYKAHFGLTDVAMAERAGVTPTAMGRYMSGERVPAAAVMLRIIYGFDGWVLPNDFFKDVIEEAMTKTVTERKSPHRIVG